MKCFGFGSRQICFVSSEDAVTGQFLRDKYAILIFADVETIVDWTMLGSLLSSNCAEVYCIGTLAEKTHDILDEIIESRGFFEVATTWGEEETIDDSVLYFLNVAGAKPATLLAITNGEMAVEEALKRATAH